MDDLNGEIQYMEMKFRTVQSQVKALNDDNGYMFLPVLDSLNSMQLAEKLRDLESTSFQLGSDEMLYMQQARELNVFSTNVSQQ